MRILVTGFDPFGGSGSNASELVVKQLWSDVVTCFVPTVFGRAADVVLEAIAAEQPDAVVCLGEAAGRTAITPERVAINVADASIPDNAGYQPVDEPIEPTGPAARFSTLPIKAMVRAIEAAGVKASVSNTAGTFVCNHLMYRVLAETGDRIPAGFIHVPTIDDMPLDTTVRGITAALETLGRS